VHLHKTVFTEIVCVPAFEKIAAPAPRAFIVQNGRQIRRCPGFFHIIHLQIIFHGRSYKCRKIFCKGNIVFAAMNLNQLLPQGKRIKIISLFEM